MSMSRRTTLAGAAAVAGIALAAGTAQAERERHPKIRAAIRALNEAKEEMQHADHDFGGHRVAAMHECDEAIRQLREALHYDKH